MIRKATALVSFGAGYVLGAKAGQERYRQIMTKIDELKGTAPVQQATAAATDLAHEAAETVKDTVKEKVGGKTVDLTEETPATMPASAASSAGTAF